MPLSPIVINTILPIITQTLGKVSEPATKMVIAIIVEHGPKAKAQAKILEAVAKVAPWAVSIVSSSIALAIASVGLRKEVRVSIVAGQFGIQLEGTSRKKRKTAKTRPQKITLEPSAARPRRSIKNKQAFALPK